MHALKASEKEFNGFQEAYFSIIKKDKIKAWKKHLKMTMNLIVPIGSVMFVFYDEKGENFKTIEIGEKIIQELQSLQKYGLDLLVNQIKIV